jgi:hypothetical protein
MELSKLSEIYKKSGYGEYLRVIASNYEWFWR